MVTYLRNVLFQWLRVTVFSSVLTLFFVVVFSGTGFPAVPSDPLLAKDRPVSQTDIVAVDKIADGSVEWVAVGADVLAYGSDQRVVFCLVEEPSAPVSSLTFDGVISEAVIIGNHAVLSEAGQGLRIVGLRVPSDPVNMGVFPLSGEAFHLAGWGNVVFVSGIKRGTQAGIARLELLRSGRPDSDPHLIELGFIPLAEPITAMTVSESSLYVATAGERVRIYDVSDPSMIAETGVLPVAVSVKSMTVDGEALFVAAGTKGLQIIDFSTGGMEALAVHPMPCESLVQAGRLIYSAAGKGGLHLLKADPLAGTTFHVSVTDGSFVPATINIQVGDTVLWTWAGSKPHSSTSGNLVFNKGITYCNPDGIWDSGTPQTTGTFQYTFDSPGRFLYFSRVDCRGMTGTVSVSDQAQTILPSIAPGSVNFGNVSLGQFSDQAITITNLAGSTGALSVEVGVPAAPFSIVSGGGPFTLNPGHSMGLVIRFSPTEAGSASGSLVIMHNGTNPTDSARVSLSGTGVALSMPNVVISTIIGPIKGKPGSRIPIESTVTNEGSLAAGKVTVNFYLSADTQIDPVDTLIGRRTIPSLAPGASDGPASTTVTLPRTIAPGAYFIGGIVGGNVGGNTNFDPQGITLCLSLTKPRLLSPRNRGTNVSATPVLEWSDVDGVSIYDVQVATDPGFTNIVADADALTGSQWTIVSVLQSGATYFWHVRGINPCGQGPWSPTWSFKTM